MEKIQDKLKKSYILMVDDNHTNLALLVAILEDEGYEDLQIISDPRQVQAAVAERMPDLLLLDIRMPHVSGHEVLAMLRDHYGDELMPVIVLTAQTDMETRLKALGGGARDFLTKPFDHTEVLHRIHNNLEVHALYKERRNNAVILEQQVAERTRELNYLANHDPITGLSNRRVLLNELRSQSGSTIALLYLTFDATERVADLLGHTTVDCLMRAAAERLQNNLPSDCILGSWGFKDFLIIDPREQGEHTLDLTRQVLEILREPIQLDSNLVQLHMRIGIMQNHGIEPEKAVRLASMALPHPNSGQAWRYFSTDIEQQIQHRFELEKNLRTALDDGELQLVFQPKVDLSNGKVTGAEALMRWHSSKLGHVSPAEFIPVAEETGLVVAMGDWALHHACTLLGEWRLKGVVTDDFVLAVNLATRQLENATLSSTVNNILQTTKLPGRVLELEVTESGLMQDINEASAMLNRLNALGCNIAIDDFGTGYSSLAYLKRLPVNTLKIDQSFVRDMHEDENDRVIARTVIAMAKALGMKVVAEGIETGVHAELLHDFGCDVGQGYYYARPLDTESFCQFMREQQ